MCESVDVHVAVSVEAELRLAESLSLRRKSVLKAVVGRRDLTERRVVSRHRSIEDEVDTTCVEKGGPSALRQLMDEKFSELFI